LDAGRTASAMKSLDELLDDPTADMLNLKAWVLATTTDTQFYRPAEAMELARRACEWTGYAGAASLDTLAICQAALGNFPEAIRLVQLALPIAPADKLEECRIHLSLFQAAKPYRESPPSRAGVA
jgi:tetratricopeptide (TPR) repeat protein